MRFVPERRVTSGPRRSRSTGSSSASKRRRQRRAAQDARARLPASMPCPPTTSASSRSRRSTGRSRPVSRSRSERTTARSQAVAAAPSSAPRNMRWAKRGSTPNSAIARPWVVSRRESLSAPSAARHLGRRRAPLLVADQAKGSRPRRFPQAAICNASVVRSEVKISGGSSGRRRCCSLSGQSRMQIPGPWRPALPRR